MRVALDPPTGIALAAHEIVEDFAIPETRKLLRRIALLWQGIGIATANGADVGLRACVRGGNLNEIVLVNGATPFFANAGFVISWFGCVRFRGCSSQ